MKQSVVIGHVAPEKRRLAWPDVAKGLSILDVVLLHVTLVVPDARLMEPLAVTNDFFLPLRMPLFFLVSGYFSVKVLRQSLSQLFLKRLWFFLIPYLFWVPAQLFARNYNYHIAAAEPLITWSAVWDATLRAHNMGWFLYALAAFNIALWFLKFLPRPLAIALSIVVPLGFLPRYEDFHMIAKMLMYLPIFLFGALYRDVITRYVQRLTRIHKSWHGLVYVGIASLLYVTGLQLRQWWDGLEGLQTMQWPLPNADHLVDVELLVLIKTLQQFLSLPMAIAFVLLLSLIKPLSAFLQFLGRNTLPIYLSHPIALSLLLGVPKFHLGAEVVQGGAWPLESPLFWVLWGVGACTIGSFLLWAIGKLPVLGWVLTPPRLVALEDHADGTQEKRVQRKKIRHAARRAAQHARHRLDSKFEDNAIRI